MNQICTAGRLCQNPQLREVNGNQLCSFTLASRSTQKGSDGQYITVFYQVDVWGPRGESCAKHLRKGGQAAVTGELIPQTFSGSDGQTHHKLKVKANGVTFLGPRPASAEQPQPTQQEYYDNSDEDDLPF